MRVLTSMRPGDLAVLGDRQVNARTNEHAGLAVLGEK